MDAPITTINPIIHMALKSYEPGLMRFIAKHLAEHPVEKTALQNAQKDRNARP